MTANNQKDTLYIDIDDEITTVIDKLRSSPHRIVALVLPKRAAVFQSIVNMKLLKRTADEAKKHVVLITAEAGLLPLAGAVGLHIARTLQSRPEVPPPPSRAQTLVSAAAEDEIPLDKNQSVGELAGEAPAEDEEIEVDNSAETPKPAKGAKPKKNKKLRVPNFDSFRKRLILGGAVLVLFIVGWVVAFKILPKATVTLETDTTNLDTSLNFTADTKATALDQDKSVIPAVSKESRKTDTEKTAATGQKDLGDKAAGKASLKNCMKVVGSVTIPAGTTISTSGLAFVTDDAAVLPASSFDGGGACQTVPSSVAVTAANPGEQYNIEGGKSFTVAGYSTVTGVDSTTMTGGTSKIVKIVSQADIDGAKQKITDRSNTDATKDLTKEFEEENYHALAETLAAAEPTVTSTNKVGEEAADVTVTSTVSSTMLGVKKDDLKKLIEENAKKQLDQNKQQIIDNGIAKATLRLQQKLSDSQTTIAFRGIVVAGPKLDGEAIKKEIVGKRRGQAQDIIRKRPGIKDVEIAYSPFWVQATPKSTDKITIVFKQSKDDADHKD